MDNHQEILKRLDRQDENFRLHSIQDEVDFSQRPTKDEMKQIVHDALIEFFATKGTLTKNVLLTTAMIIGALVVIAGGFKWLIGIFGFTIMTK